MDEVLRSSGAACLTNLSQAVHSGMRVPEVFKTDEKFGSAEGLVHLFPLLEAKKNHTPNNHNIKYFIV